MNETKEKKACSCPNCLSPHTRRVDPDPRVMDDYQCVSCGSYFRVLSGNEKFVIKDALGVTRLALFQFERKFGKQPKTDKEKRDIIQTVIYALNPPKEKRPELEERIGLFIEEEYLLRLKARVRGQESFVRERATEIEKKYGDGRKQ